MGFRKIAVVVRDRQSEALRMSVGLTVVEDTVDIFLCRPLKTGADTMAQLEGVREFGLSVFTTVEGTEFDRLTTEEMAERLLDYDQILPY